MTSTAESALSPNAHRDARLEGLTAWVASLFGDANSTIAPASADASFRRYFRVTRGADTWIAMDAPPEKEDMGPYINVAGMLNRIGVNAPRILHQNTAEGYLLNSDLGSRTYLQALAAPSNASELYIDAIDALVQIQAGGREYVDLLPPYDAAMLQREMKLFPEWFCGRHLGLEFSPDEVQALQVNFDALAASALEQPRVFVHRDYHSRNLMVGDGERFGLNPGILDFQDAVSGAVTYDLVSLLRDCYIAWPLEQTHGWLDDYRVRATAAGVIGDVDRRQFIRWFDWMGVQRHLKAIGIFARLWHRDGKPGYLKDIPRTLDYVRHVTGKYEELRFLREFIAANIDPLSEQIPLAR